MKIVKAHWGRLRIPLRVPFKTALRTVDQVDDCVLRLSTDNGRHGYGSAAATARITGETHGSIEAAWQEHLLPTLGGLDVRDWHAGVLSIQRAMAFNGSAKAAVECALLDLAAQAAGVPLCGLFGGTCGVIYTDITISANPIEQMLRDVDHALKAGYRTLKIKLGSDPLGDPDRIAEIARRIGPDVALRLDVNQAWNAQQTVSIMRQIESSGINAQLIEQPVPADAIDALAFIRARIATPLLADESVFNARELLALKTREAADLVNIKLLKCGGPLQAIKLAELAETLGYRALIGCMLESPIGVAAAAHVAMARPQVIVHADLDAPALALSNPVQSNVRFMGPRIDVGNAPGLGIEKIEGWVPSQQMTLA